MSKKTRKNLDEESVEQSSTHVCKLPIKEDQWIARNVVGTSLDFRKSIVDYRNRSYLKR